MVKTVSKPLPSPVVLAEQTIAK